MANQTLRHHTRSVPAEDQISETWQLMKELHIDAI